MNTCQKTRVFPAYGRVGIGIKQIGALFPQEFDGFCQFLLFRVSRHRIWAQNQVGIRLDMGWNRVHTDVSDDLEVNVWRLKPGKLGGYLVKSEQHGRPGRKEQTLLVGCTGQLDWII